MGFPILVLALAVTLIAVCRLYLKARAREREAVSIALKATSDLAGFRSRYKSAKLHFNRSGESSRRLIETMRKVTLAKLADLRSAENQLKDIQNALVVSKAETRKLAAELASRERDIAASRRQLARNRSELDQVYADRQGHDRVKWLDSLALARYRNEMEVETKFIWRLVKFLDYDDASVEIRVPVQIQAGSKTVQAEADWVLWSRGRIAGSRHPRLVIEAKAPSVALGGIVQQQARSYAIALGATMYAITNGKGFVVYKRGVTLDDCIISCGPGGLKDDWPNIVRTIGADIRTGAGPHQR